MLPLAEMRSVLLLSSLALPSLLTACDDPRTETRLYQNEGGICLSPRAEGGAHVQVLLSDCVSACAELEASCSVAVEAGVVVVVAEGTTTRDLDSQSDCPDLCLALEASCQLLAQPEGTYELRYGERTVNVQLPLASRIGVLPAGQTDDVCGTVPPLP